MVIMAAIIGLAAHSLLWFGSLGPAIFWPLPLLFMLGPALLPTTVVALLIGISTHHDRWSRVLAVATLVFVLEQIVFWLWHGTVDDTFGYSMLYFLPIFGGWFLAVACYGAVKFWRAR